MKEREMHTQGGRRWGEGISAEESLEQENQKGIRQMEWFRMISSLVNEGQFP